MIIESSYPEDFYHNRLDGNSVSGLLYTMRIENKLRYVLDFEHFKKALEECAEGRFEVLHISCHGGEDGIALADNVQPDWNEFCGAFQDMDYVPPVLVMSACCGASSGIAQAFARQEKHPKIILGSQKALTYSQYAAAWSILYHRFQSGKLNRDTAQLALKQIVAVVDKSFRYLRWDGEKKKFLHYPCSGKSYTILETQDNG